MKNFIALCTAAVFASAGGKLPSPATDVTASATKQTAVFAGGCFWGVEAVFERLKGVSEAVSGYAGGTKKNPDYEQVSSGRTGHAESSQISYGQLLQVFFSVAHDPTTLNRQGPDEGTQYRSAIFYTNDEQKRVAEAYIRQINDAKVFRKPIVTQVTPLNGFYAAEGYHQHYFDHHPNEPYIVYNDAPKVRELQKQFPELLAKK
jgi:peptide-methionine (S)-S-oxide reductase